MMLLRSAPAASSRAASARWMSSAAAPEGIDTATLFSLAGRTALVTGGSRGIGKMITEAFLQAGATVYISARKAKDCEATAAALSDSYGGRCMALPADMSSDKGRAALVSSLTDSLSGLDVLVNNAGANWAAPYEDFPEVGFDKVLHLNLTGLFYLTRDLTPLLRAGAASSGEPSRVINVGSIDGLMPPPPTGESGTWPYGASKAAVHHLTRALAAELAPDIHTNAIAARWPSESGIRPCVQAGLSRALPCVTDLQGAQHPASRNAPAAPRLTH